MIEDGDQSSQAPLQPIWGGGGETEPQAGLGKPIRTEMRSR